MTKFVIYDQFGQAAVTIEDAEDNKILWGEHFDHQAILDDNARARSMARLGGVSNNSGFEPVARYHETMKRHWLAQDGISQAAFRKWPPEERIKYIDRKLAERDYRKFNRRDQKGMYI